MSDSVQDQLTDEELIDLWRSTRPHADWEERAVAFARAALSAARSGTPTEVSRENQGQPTDDLTRILDEIDECLRYEKDGTTVPVPVEDLRVIRAALSGTTTEWGVQAQTFTDGEWDRIFPMSEAGARERIRCAHINAERRGTAPWERLASREVTEWREVKA